MARKQLTMQDMADYYEAILNGKGLPESARLYVAELKQRAIEADTSAISPTDKGCK